MTDYLIQPLDFSDGQIHAISWTTTAAGGFSAADLAALEAIRRPLARLTEIYALRRVLTTLLTTYVGRSTGAAHSRGPHPARRHRAHRGGDPARRPARLHEPERPLPGDRVIGC